MPSNKKQTLLRSNRLDELKTASDEINVSSRNALIELLISIYIDTHHDKIVALKCKDELQTIEAIKKAMS